MPRGVAGWEPGVKKALHLPVGHRMGVGGSSNPLHQVWEKAFPSCPRHSQWDPGAAAASPAHPGRQGTLSLLVFSLTPGGLPLPCAWRCLPPSRPAEQRCSNRGLLGFTEWFLRTRRTLGSSCQAHALGRPECLGAIGVTRPLRPALRVRPFWGRSGAESGPQSGRAPWAADRAQAGRAPGCPIGPLWPEPSTPQPSPAGQATGTHHPAPRHACPWSGLGPCSVGAGLQALPAQLLHRDRGRAWLRPVGSVPGLGHSHPTCVDRQRAKPLSLCSSPWLGPRAARLWGCLALKRLSLTRSQPARGLVVASPLPTQP